MKDHSRVALHWGALDPASFWEDGVPAYKDSLIFEGEPENYQQHQLHFASHNDPPQLSHIYVA